MDINKRLNKKEKLQAKKEIPEYEEMVFQISTQ